MKNAMVGFVFGILCYFGAGYVGVSPAGSCPVMRMLHPITIVCLFGLGFLFFGGALDRLTEWKEAQKFSYPVPVSGMDAREALLVCVVTLFPGFLFIWAGATNDGSVLIFFVASVSLFISCHLYLRRFKPVIG